MWGLSNCIRRFIIHLCGLCKCVRACLCFLAFRRVPAKLRIIQFTFLAVLMLWTLWVFCRVSLYWSDSGEKNKHASHVVDDVLIFKGNVYKYCVGLKNTELRTRLLNTQGTILQPASLPLYKVTNLNNKHPPAVFRTWCESSGSSFLKLCGFCWACEWQVVISSRWLFEFLP